MKETKIPAYDEFKLIKEEKKRFEKIKEFENRKTNFLLGLDLVEPLLDEDDSEQRDVVIELIKADSWETDATKFRKALEKSKHILMLTIYDDEELKQMKLFKLKGYNIGFALKKHDGKFSEIVSVFNNEPDIKDIGSELVKSAIKHGGKYLDHFDGKLTNFYKDLGFVEISRDKYNPEYDKDGEFAKKYGKKDVIYREYKG